MNLASNILKFTGRTLQQSLIPNLRSFHAVQQAIVQPLVLPCVWSFTQIRTNVRNKFPKPREVKRVKVHGWRARLSTKGGRRVIMSRMLKGRFVLAH